MKKIDSLGGLLCHIIDSDHSATPSKNTHCTRSTYGGSITPAELSTTTKQAKKVVSWTPQGLRTVIEEQASCGRSKVNLVIKNPIDRLTSAVLQKNEKLVHGWLWPWPWPSTIRGSPIECGMPLQQLHQLVE